MGTVTSPRARARFVLAQNETILVVEDQEALRAMIREVLEDGGYSVVEYAAPTAVVEEIDRLGRIDVLLTDVVMPRMSGPELAGTLRRTHPHLKVLFISGYTDQAVGHQGVFAPGQPVPPEAVHHRRPLGQGAGAAGLEAGMMRLRSSG